MGAALLAALAALALSAPASAQASPDTLGPFASPATRALVERAMGRHRAQDSAVTDYEARLRYRLSTQLGRRRWGRGATLGVEEQEMLVHWQRPNDLRIDVVGRRVRTRSKEIELSSVFRRPWFVPRGLGDSVRIFSDEFPATGALHPLAESGPEWYRYALTDSVRLTAPGSGAPLKLYLVEVRPRRTAPALVTGRFWIDSASAEVTRWSFRYVGTGLYAKPEHETRGDSTSARRLNALANRIVTIDADLEYGLQDGRYWMPYRQTLSGVVQVPIVSDVVVSFQAVTTFDDYAIDTGRPIAFTRPLPGESPAADSARRAERDSLRAARRRGERPDSLRPHDRAGRWAGGRFEIHRPSDDSLAHFRDWGDSLELATTPEDQRRIEETRADLAHLAHDLPDDLTGRRAHGFAYERLGDAFRYDRVEGLSLGLGYRVRLPGTFNDLYATARYGFSDERPTGRLAAVHDGPAGRWVLAGYRELADLDPFSSRRGIGNTFNALFTAHDNGAYHLATGGALSYETTVATGIDAAFTARLDDERSVTREARSKVNDWIGGTGLFPANPPIVDGTFGGASVRLTGIAPFGWTVGADGLAGAGTSTARLWGESRHALGAVQGMTLRLKGGIATSPTLPQMAFRAGGLNTVRGYDYGTQAGQAFWAAQLDVSLLRGGGIRPVLFADAGHAARAADLFRGPTLVGGGIGFSLYSSLLRTSLLRIDISRQLEPVFTKKLRVDLVFSAPR